MNLNKYTKAELISKLNKIKNDRIEQKSSIINRLKSYLSKLIELIINFKSILLKISLLTFFIKIFRKYRIFRRIWTILNSIIVSIFGLSLIDNFGFDLVNKVIFEIKYISYSMVDYLTNTQFYKYLSDLFNKNDEIQSNKTNIINKEIINKELIRKHKSSGGVWTPTDTPEYKLSEWLKNKDQDIQEPKINYNKYFLIAGTIIIISCLGWVYSDEITTGGTSFLEWIRSFRGDNDPGNNNRNLPREGRIDPRAELERLVRERTIGTEEKLSDLMDKSKGKSVRVMSPSLEDLNEKVQESWNTSPTSSTSSIETIEKNKGNVLENNTEASSSKITLEEIKPNTTGNSNILESLSNKFNKMTKIIDDEENNNDEWEDNNPTPTNLSDKGKEVERSISPDMLSYASDTVKVDKSQKFLEAIKHDESNISESTSLPPKLSNTVKAIKRLFPNISEETINKLNSVEGIKNRQQIIDLIPDNELIPTNSKDITPLNKLLNEKSSIVSHLSNIERETGIMKIDTLIDVINDEPGLNKDLTEEIIENSIDLKLKELIDENPSRSKQELTELLIKENPKHIDKILSIISKTMDDQYSIWKDKFSENEFKKLDRILSKEDLKERAALAENKTTEKIKILKAVNKSHVNLLNEIKRKPSLMSIKENKFNESNIDNKFNDTNNLFE